MNDSKAERFVRLVCQNTLAGKISWREDENDTIIAEVGGYAVIFSREVRDDGAYYTLTISNAAGDEIDSYTDTDLDEPGTSANEGSVFKLMDAAYAQGRLIAKGADKALDQLLLALGEEPGELAIVEPANGFGVPGHKTPVVVRTVGFYKTVMIFVGAQREKKWRYWLQPPPKANGT
jgi:hypothetical protein